MKLPDNMGHYGEFGGRYVSETLMPALLELEQAYNQYKDDDEFNEELNFFLKEFVGRENPLYFAERFSEKYGIKTKEDIQKLSKAGVDAFLIGESFMRADKPGEMLNSFVN